MAKIFAIHTLALNPGVKGEDFEKFVKEEWYPNFAPPPHATGHLLKGRKGDREGKYLWLWEFDNVNATNPVIAWQETPQNKALIEKWYTFERGFGVIVTDYIAIE